MGYMTITTELSLSGTALRMLNRIDYLNLAGIKPSKAVVVTLGHARTPSRTRAYRYIMIDRMINAGLIHNSGTPSCYRLSLTDDGRRALDAS